MSADLLKEFDLFYQAGPVTVTTKDSTDTSNVSHLSKQNNSGVQPAADQHELTSYHELWGLGSLEQVEPKVEAKRNTQAALERATDDDWGDFEAAESTGAIPAKNIDLKWTVRETQDPLSSSNPTHIPKVGLGPVYKSMPLPPAHAKQAASIPMPRVVRDENVLFDAEDDDDEDDFGDFEGVSEAPPTIPWAPPIASKNTASNSLLDFNDDDDDSMVRDREPVPKAVYDHRPTPPQAAAVPAYTAKSNRSKPGTLPGKPTQVKPLVSHSKPLPPPPPPVNDEAWEDFDESLPEPNTLRPSTPPAATNTLSAKKTPAQPPTKNQVPEDRGLAILNLALSLADDPITTTPAATHDVDTLSIPPPAALLPLFPPIFALAYDKLFGPLSTHAASAPARAAILQDARTRAFLAAYLDVTTVLARVIAGRKHRWKRDTRLAQSVRIGPATSAAGGKGGMKLVGVDRAESAREDKEVGEVVRAWRVQAGKVRSAVVGAGVATAVPDVVETLGVRSATAAEGAMTAPRACAFCGLKRDERVARVESGVEDSFGEWWVEHWGHRTCRNFWAAQKSGCLA